jgi:monovalent cation/hydrogen antiporter
VVVAGLYTGYMAPRRFSAQFRISERLNWRTVQFILENGVFLLMGAQLKHIVDAVHTDGLDSGLAVVLGVACTGILIAVRYLLVGPLILLLRARERHIPSQQARLAHLVDRIASFVERPVHDGGVRHERRVERWQRVVTRRGNDLRQLSREGLDWRGGVVIGWAGMRGVVTLAAAQSLPRDTDYYPMLVLIAFTVAIATLLLHGGTLPLVIRATGIRGSDRAADRRELADLLDEMNGAGMALLDRDGDVTLPDGERIDDEVVQRVRHDSEIAAKIARERAEQGDDVDENADAPQRQYRLLRREVLDAEREALLDAGARNAYPSRILRRAQTLLDLEETRLEQLGTGGREAH